MTDVSLSPVDSMTWEQLEAERRSFLERTIAAGLTFDTAPIDEVQRFVAVSHRARMLVKPAGKPAGKKEKKPSPKAKSLDDLLL